MGEVGEIYTGNTPATDNPIYYSNDGIPWITPSDIVDFDTPKPAKYLSEEGLKVGRTVPAGSIMCTCIASIGKNTITSTICGFNQQINALVPNKEQYDSDFLFAESHLWSQTMKRDAAAGTMQIVNKTEFSELNILKPPLIEQQAIGSFFSRLDHLITLHQRKCQYRGLYGCLSWEQRKLGEIFEEYSEKNRADLPPLTIIQGGGTVYRDESNRNLQFDKNSLSNYKAVNPDDFIVHLRSFEGGLEKATYCGLISPAYHTFHGDGIDSDFYYLYFRSKRFIDTDLKPHVYGIRDGRSIDIDGMKTIPIPWTTVNEQRAIGGFYNSLDSFITLHQ